MPLRLDAVLATDLTAHQFATFLRATADLHAFSDDGSERAFTDALRGLADLVERATDPADAPTVAGAVLSPCPACHAAAGAPCALSCELGSGFGA